MKFKSIQQTIEFNATPEQLYQMIMDEKLHTAFTGSPAKITNRKGGKFSAYDGYINGKNIELIKYKKIIQEWHASEMPDDHTSIVTFEFVPKNKNLTAISFKHEKIPATIDADYAQGWIDFYWEPMKVWLNNNKSKK